MKLVRRTVPLLAGLVALAVVAGTVSSASAGPPAARQFGGLQAAQPLLLAATAALTCPGAPVPTASYQPSTSSTFKDTIARRGYLVVGVSGDNRLLGARNSTKKGALEGFDIDIAKAVAAAIFPDSATNSARIRLKVITAGQRFSYVNSANGGADAAGVDLVARAVTMNCDRWANADTAKSALFSAEYLRAEQKLLVRSDASAAPRSLTLKALADVKAKVCASAGSTSLKLLQTQYPGIDAVPAPLSSDCLVLWQQGQVDAITGDDAILAGFAAQDPRAVVTTEPLEEEPYGLAIGKTHVDFVRFVNSVLASPAGQAAWTKAYQQWLAPVLGAKTQPTPNYDRG